MGEDLVNVLDNLRVKTVIGLGDGAGANILLRFEMMHHTRCMGSLLINATANAAGIKDKFTVGKCGGNRVWQGKAGFFCMLYAMQKVGCGDLNNVTAKGKGESEVGGSGIFACGIKRWERGR